MENKKNDFKRIAENRVNNIIDMIGLLGNLSNSSFYEYTDEQIETIFNAIESELEKQKQKFVKKKDGRKKKFEL